MADTRSSVRTSSARALAVLVGLLAFCPPNRAEAKPRDRKNSQRKSADGILSPEPTDSAGIQLGNLGGTGVTYQRLLKNHHAANASLGFADRGLCLTADYLWIFKTKGELDPKPKDGVYTSHRGHFLPYFGAGIAIENGLHLRAPLGTQFALDDHPFVFFGTITPQFGAFFADEKTGLRLGWAIGTRLLL